MKGKVNEDGAQSRGDSNKKGDEDGDQAGGGLKGKGDEDGDQGGDCLKGIGDEDGEAACDTRRSLGQSENSGNGSDDRTSSSKRTQVEDTVVIVLHAFIQPDAWGIDSKDIQQAVLVLSDYLKWKENCATVTVR